MKILITTPTGIIGRKILPELLAPEFFVRVIARDPGSLSQEIRGQVDIIPGSIDPRTLRGALQEIDALFLCIPQESSLVSKAETYEHIARTASVAIREAATPRVVSISECSSDSLAWEDILNESGAAIRHIRCGFFTDHLPATLADTVADLALRLLVRTDWSGIETLSVRGQEDISVDERDFVESI